MPRTLQEILDHASEISAEFEQYDFNPADQRPVEPMQRARKAVQARAAAERAVAEAVKDMRDAGYSWPLIGTVLGTSGEAARQRYGSPRPSAGRESSTTDMLGYLERKVSEQKQSGAEWTVPKKTNTVVKAVTARKATRAAAAKPAARAAAAAAKPATAARAVSKAAAAATPKRTVKPARSRKSS